MPKVFISSKQGELDPERAALHHALQSPEWDNFTIEFSGAFPDSVRDVFLQHVAECDVYLGIFASVYSQPTVDEYHKAKELGKPILIYLKRSTDRDPQLQDFIRTELQLSHKYQEFSTTEELVTHLPDIRRALDAEVQKHQRQAYLDALIAQTELLELAGIVDSGERERPKLQEIFVALSAAEEVDERDEHQTKDKHGRERPIKITRRVTINEVLRQHRHLMILGDPGSGKSTLLRYVALAFAENEAEKYLQLREQALPILIRLSSFAQSRQSFLEYFETYAEKQLHVSLGKKFFERALDDGQSIVCLDGLDEVSQPAQRIDVRNAITALANRYPRNRFIVTSRVAGYDSTSFDKRAFAHHTIVPFGENEIQSFVEKWYAAREREPEQTKTRAANLFNDLKANERLLKLAENPLTLTIIALVHQRAQGKLPDARVELYDRCAETLIEEWDKWKGLAPEDRERPYYRLRRRLLECAAYWMHIDSQEADVAQILKRALEMKVAEFLIEDKTLNLSEDTARIEAKQFVALATSRTGIWVEREQGAVSFIHLTFQEYFAASDLYWRYRRTPDALWRTIQPHLYDSRWLEVILLLLGRLNNEGDTTSIIVEKILREHDKFDDVVHRDLFLAARIAADGVNIKEHLRIAITNQLGEFISDQHPRFTSLRSNAIKTLGTFRGNKHAANALLALAQGSEVSAWTRFLAARALRQLGWTNDAMRLLLGLAYDKEAIWEMGDNVVKELGQLGQTDDTVVQELLTLAQDKKLSDSMRIAVAHELGQLGQVDDAKRLLSALAQNEMVFDQFRMNAALELELLGERDDAERLLLALAQDEKMFGSSRCEAAQALIQLGKIDDAAQVLLALARDAMVSDGVRRDSVVALGQLGRTDDVLQLLLLLAHDERVEDGVREDCALLLGQLGRTGDTARLLLELALNEGIIHYVRTSCLREFGLLKRIDGTSVHKILALVQDTDEFNNLRCAAAESLGQLGCRDDYTIHELLVLAQNELVDDDVLCAVAQALGELGLKEDAVRLLLHRTQREQDIFFCFWDDQIKVIRVLTRMGRTDESVKLLLALAKNKRISRTGQCAVADTLGQLGQVDKAIRLFIACAQDKMASGEVLSHAIGGLRQLGNRKPHVALTLLNLVSVKDEDIGREAYDALEEVVGNFRYVEVDNGRKRIKRTKKKIPNPKSKTSNRKSKIRNPDTEIG